MKTKIKIAAIALGLISLTFTNNVLAKETPTENPCPLIFYGEMILTNESVSLCVNGSKGVFERKDLDTNTVKIKIEKEASYFSSIIMSDAVSIYFRDPEDKKYWYSLENTDGLGNFLRLVDVNHGKEDHIPRIGKDKTFPLKSETLVLDKELLKKINTVANQGKP